MHGSIRDCVEALLAAGKTAGQQDGLLSDDVLGHLSSCDDCLAEVELMKEQAVLFRSLRPTEEVEPAPGFYGRVLQRIEDRTTTSMWSVLIYSSFGKRLMYGSLSAALVLGTYVVTLESLDGHLQQGGAVAFDDRNEAPVFGSQDEQRDAVLENFAAYSASARRTQTSPISYKESVQ